MPGRGAFAIAGAALVGALLVAPGAYAAPAADPARQPGEPTCYGQQATITGNDRGNRIDGTPGDDVIVGLGGFDRIDGRGGDDLICAGRGGDQLYGGSGDDRLDGGRNGRFPDDDFSTGDRLVGGPGNDRLDGGGTARAPTW